MRKVNKIEYLGVLVSILFTISILFLFSSCEKKLIDGPVTVFMAGDTTFGYATALKNGVAFDASGHGLRVVCEEGTDHAGKDVTKIQIQTHGEDGFLREIILLATVSTMTEDSFYNIPIVPCGEPILGGYTNGFADEGFDSYNLSLDYNNWVYIEKCDTNTNEIIGEFELQYLLDKSKPKTESTSLEIVTFTEGKFRLKFFN